MIISSVYKGSQEFVKGYKGTTLMFDNTPTEPVAAYVTDGLVANWSGYDDYVDGAWVDRVGGYNITPLNAGLAAPFYDAENKLYNTGAVYNGMISDLVIGTDTNYTLEYVFRDAKNTPQQTAAFGCLAGGVMNGWNVDRGILVCAEPSLISFCVFRNISEVCRYNINKSAMIDGGLDVFTAVPGVGLFYNGAKVRDFPASTIDSNIGLFSFSAGGSFNTAYKAQGKVHAVRYYNRPLTAEEVLHNYNTDVSVYGA